MTNPKQQGLVGLAMILGLGATDATAGGTWTNEDICGAATSAYFFLSAPALVVGSVDGWTILRSESGNTYDCRIAGDTALFRWKIDRGPMSGKTPFARDGRFLHVHTDMGSETFELDGAGWHAAD